MKFTYTRCRLNTTDSADDEHRGARNMYRIGINIYEKNCTSSWLFTRIKRHMKIRDFWDMAPCQLVNANAYHCVGFLEWIFSLFETSVATRVYRKKSHGVF